MKKRVKAVSVAGFALARVWHLRRTRRRHSPRLRYHRRQQHHGQLRHSWHRPRLPRGPSVGLRRSLRSPLNEPSAVKLFGRRRPVVHDTRRGGKDHCSDVRHRVSSSSRRVRRATLEPNPGPSLRGPGRVDPAVLVPRSTPDRHGAQSARGCRGCAEGSSMVGASC